MDISVSLPLDSDGFLRRACPACAGQFKWRPDQPDDQEGTQAEPGGYYCPLCGHQAPAEEWSTADQDRLIEKAVRAAAMQATQQSLTDAFRNSSAVTFSPGNSPRNPAALTEPDDMMIVGSPCHPEEPIKVPEDTADPLRCLVCGADFAV